MRFFVATCLDRGGRGWAGFVKVGRAGGGRGWAELILFFIVATKTMFRWLCSCIDFTRRLCLHDVRHVMHIQTHTHTYHLNKNT